MKYKLEKPVHGEIGLEKYQCTIEWRNGQFIADEPVANGGKDEGPDPYTLLLSSLATCTLVTMRMYIERKGWDVPEISVNANMYFEVTTEKTTTVIDRDIHFAQPLPEEQRNRLLEIARHCPISKILEGEIHVRTFVFKEPGEAKTIKYHNDDVTVEWRPELCQHSTRCWKQLPEVFNPKEKKWINVDGAGGEELKKQVQECPSGALQFSYNKDQQETGNI
ncbi:(4Fe-4S)-binding protein [Chitinophagaceae bacterium MMS25-I14]